MSEQFFSNAEIIHPRQIPGSIHFSLSSLADKAIMNLKGPVMEEV